MGFIIKLLNIFAFALLTYSFCVVVNVESINSQEEGGILQNWHREQRMSYPDGCCGSGIGKMRIHGHFQTFLTRFGLPVYPACVLSAFIFFLEIRRSKNMLDKSLFCICFLMNVAILARFMWLGVFSAGIGS